jgi:predicted PurR-regulated permease PerM
MFVKSLKVTRIAALFIILALSIVCLVLGKQLIIPFMFAILIWLLMRKFREVLDKIPVIAKWIPRWVKTILSAALFVGIFILLGSVLEKNLLTLIRSIEKHPGNFDIALKQLENYLPSQQEIQKQFNIEQNLGKAFTIIINSLGTVLQNALVILFYVIFILLEESSFKPKLHALFPKKVQFDRSTVIFEKIEKSVTDYIGLKSLIAVIAGALSYFILLFAGIEAPFFWALIIMVMNFIPTIGSLVGTLFPALFAMIQFGDVSYGLMILFLVGGIQMLVGNFLEPRLMGNSLNLSPLVAIIALAFWGTIWGIPGMFLSVPITVIMVIVFSHFPATKSAAILLSEKGFTHKSEEE